MPDGWTEVYQNAPDGRRVSGSLNDLVSHVLRGADVKVGYSLTQGNNKNLFWRRLCSSVTVTEEFDDHGTGGPIDPNDIFHVVSGIVTDVPDTNLGPGISGRVFAEPFAVEWQMFNTSGVRQVVEFNRQTLNVISNTTSNLQMAWFIRS